MNDYLINIQDGESVMVEFKDSTAKMLMIIEILCAFTNNHEGMVFIGVIDQGRIAGQNTTDDSLKDISNALQLYIEPKLYPEIEQIEKEGKKCIKIIIENSPLKPYLAYGRPLKRVGVTNQKLYRKAYEYFQQQPQNGLGIKNTIEIWSSFIHFQNPGILFKPKFTVKKLTRPHPSRPENNLIAKVFYMSGLFEIWENGT